MERCDCDCLLLLLLLGASSLWDRPSCSGTPWPSWQEVLASLGLCSISAGATRCKSRTSPRGRCAWPPQSHRHPFLLLPPQGCSTSPQKVPPRAALQHSLPHTSSRGKVHPTASIVKTPPAHRTPLPAKAAQSQRPETGTAGAPAPAALGGSLHAPPSLFQRVFQARGAAGPIAGPGASGTAPPHNLHQTVPKIQPAQPHGASARGFDVQKPDTKS